MAEMCRERLWNSLIRFYVCLNLLYTLVESRSHGEIECSMPKWGITYMGSRNVTKTGKACQPWAEETPHPVNPEIRDENFPEGSKQEAQNFCRNPYPATKYGVWCYSMEADLEWDYCDPCPGAHEKYPGCTLLDRGGEYTGQLDHSQSHMECDLWSNHKSSKFNFPDGSPEKAKNYCRNPDTKRYEAPWCFVKGMTGLSWDYCDICLPFQGKLKKLTGSYNKGSTQIDAMNRLACIRWCITWLSCLGVVIPHGESGSQCWYLTSLNTGIEENGGWDQYNVLRSCPAPAENKAGHFVELPQYPSEKGGYLAEGSVEECDKACLDYPDCVMYDRYSKDGKCYSHTNIDDKYFHRTEATARHIIRCDQSLKPPVDISDIVDSQAETSTPSIAPAAAAAPSELPAPPPQPPEEPLPDLTPLANQANRDQSPSNNGSINAESAESTEAPKEETGFPMTYVAGAAVAVVVLAGGGFAYYKLVYKKGKKGKKESKNKGSKAEKQKLTTSRRPPKRQKGKSSLTSKK